MKLTKQLVALLAESTLWLIAIWAFYVSTANILSDWQTTDRTFIANFNEAVALFPLTILYLFGHEGPSMFLALTIGVIIIFVAIYTARKKKLLRSRNFSSLKILLFAYVAFTCVDFARYGLAWSTQSFTAQQNSFENIEFDSTRYIYVDQTGSKYNIVVSALNGNKKEVLSELDVSDMGVPLYPSPDGRYFLTVSANNQFRADTLHIRSIDGDVVKEFTWTGGQFLDHRKRPTFDTLSVLWSPKGDFVAIKGNEYDGSERTVGNITILNTQDFSKMTVPDFTAELMDVGSDDQGQFLFITTRRAFGITIELI